MKFSLLTTTLLSALFPSLVLANFDVYEIGENNAGDSAYGAYAIFEGEPDCHGLMKYPVAFFGGDDDVSGGRRGVRCEGRGCYSGNVGEIDILEMNLGGRGRNDPVWHWSEFCPFSLSSLIP